MATFISCASGAWSAVHTWGDSSEECVTNGTFTTDSDWTKGTGITINTGTGLLVGTNVGSGVNASQTPTGSKVIQSGRTYTCIFDIKSLSASDGLKIMVGGTSGTTRTAVADNITEDIVAGADGTIKIQTTTSSNTFTVDNVRVSLKTEAIPGDNEPVVIGAGTSVLMDTDTSGFATGVNGLTINGGSTPGKLYCCDGYNGYLKMKAGTYISGTSGTNAAQFIVNSTGNQGGTTPLSQSNSFIVELLTGSQFRLQYLVFEALANHPTNEYVTPYETKYDFNAATAVSVADNTIDLGVTPPAAGTVVGLKASAGATLPAPLTEYDRLYVRSVVGTTCKLSWFNNDTNYVDITSVGSGTCSLYTGFSSTSTATLTVFEDVSADSIWSTTAPFNKIFVADCSVNMYHQVTTLSGKTSSSVTMAANNDRARAPLSRLYLLSRNVMVIQTVGSVTVFNCNSAGLTAIIGCAVVTTSGTHTGYLIYGGGTHNVVLSGVYSVMSYWSTGGAFQSITASGLFIDCTYQFDGISVLTKCTWSARFVGCSQVFNLCSGGMTMTGECFTSNTCGCYGLIHTSSFRFVTPNAAYGNMLAGSAFYGTIYNGNSVTANTSGVVASGEYRGCSVGVITRGDVKIVDAVFRGCTRGVQCEYTGSPVLSGCSFYQNTTDVDYGTTFPKDEGFPLMSFNHGGVANDTRSWSSGGTSTHETSVVPVDRSYSHKLTFTSASYYTTLEWPIYRPTYGDIRIIVYVLHDATGLSSDQRITWEIIDITDDPIREAGAVALDSFVAADSDQWQVDTLVVTRTDDRPLLLRARAKRGSGNAYIYCEPESAAGGFIFPFPPFYPRSS